MTIHEFLSRNWLTLIVCVLLVFDVFLFLTARESLVVVVSLIGAFLAALDGARRSRIQPLPK